MFDIVDEVTRERLAIVPDTSISGRRVAREPTDMILRRGKQNMIDSDHGAGFTSNTMLARSKDPSESFDNRRIERESGIVQSLLTMLNNR